MYGLGGGVFLFLSSFIKFKVCQSRGLFTLNSCENAESQTTTLISNISNGYISRDSAKKKCQTSIKNPPTPNQKENVRIALETF